MAELPEALIRSAKDVGLPLISLQHPAYFMEITEAVHSVIINRQYRLLQQADHAANTFSNLVVQGASTGRILRELEQMTASPVVLSDEVGNVIDYVPKSRHMFQLLQNWKPHMLEPHVIQETTRSQSCPSSPLPCTWVPVLIRGNLIATVHILSLSGECDEYDAVALERAGTAIALSLAARPGPEQQDADASSSLVYELTRGYSTDAAQVSRSAKALGAEIDFPCRICIVQPFNADDRTVSHLSASRSLGAIAKAVRRRLGHGQPALVGYDGTQVTVLWKPPAPDSASNIRRHLESLLHDLHLARQTAISGVSNPATIFELPRAYEEASEALRCARYMTRPPTVVFWAEMGIRRLLVDLDVVGTLDRHISTELGPLLDHDSKGGVSLIATLTAYLRHGGNKAKIADELSIDRRTVYHRIEKLRSLMNADLDDSTVRASLTLALEGLAFRASALEKK